LVGCRIGRRKTYRQMRGKDPQVMKEEMGHYAVQGESSLLNGQHCLIGKALCCFYSRTREIGLPTGKKPLFPYGGITVSDSGTH
jgi:hypothetical protein